MRLIVAVHVNVCKFGPSLSRNTIQPQTPIAIVNSVD